MRCLACCTALNYQFDQLSSFFKSKNYKQQYFRNVLHVQNAEANEDIFFFKHGCYVTWGLSRTQEQVLLEKIDDFSTEPLSKRELHPFVYELGEKTTLASSPQGAFDIITLEKDFSDLTLLQLAFSYGLSQSVKLRSHEISIQKIVDKNQSISRELALHGRISLSRKSIFKRVGEIFLAKNSVNLSNEYLDVSEYFWRYPHLESYYLMTEKFLDIQKRLATLNERLDRVHDVVLMLNNQLEHRHSSTLEIIIIALILGELLLNMVYHYFKF